MNDATDGRRDFFVSFNQADRDWATWIAWVLEENGYSVFFQDWDFRGSFVEQMDQAHRRAQATIAVLSDNYLASGFARSEAWAASPATRSGARTARPVKVGSITDPGLLGHFAYVDLTDCGEAEAKSACCRGCNQADASRRRAPISPAAPSAACRTAPASPLALHNLPPPNPDFVGREGPLAELRRLLTAGRARPSSPRPSPASAASARPRPPAPTAYRHLADYRLVWWLRAETPATLAADYATLAAPLGLDPAEPDQAKLTAAIRDALPDLAPVLLVFDNVEDPLLPRDYLPRAGAHVLITSRRTDWRGIARPLALELMPEAEALQLLTGRPDPEALPAADLAEAKALAADLGHLPLALAQAAAYIHECAETFAGYRELLRTSRPVMLAEGRPGPDYPEPVARTWDVSVRPPRRRAPRPARCSSCSPSSPQTSCRAGC